MHSGPASPCRQKIRHGFFHRRSASFHKCCAFVRGSSAEPLEVADQFPPEANRAFPRSFLAAHKRAVRNSRACAPWPRESFLRPPALTVDLVGHGTESPWRVRDDQRGRATVLVGRDRLKQKTSRRHKP